MYSLLALEDTLNAYSQLSDLSFDLDTESNFSIFSFLCGDERRSSGFLRGTLQRLSEGDKYRRGENQRGDIGLSRVCVCVCCQNNT